MEIGIYVKSELRGVKNYFEEVFQDRSDVFYE